MVGSRTVTALAGLAVGLAISVAAWVFFDTLAVFLFLPFVPFLFRSVRGTDDAPPIRECPVCGFRTRAPEYEYCPRDGHRLSE